MASESEHHAHDFTQDNHNKKRRKIIRKLRATSLCLVFAFMLGIGSSCANKPGSTADTNTAPPAADIPVTEEEIVTNPVDLSGLTEEELGKIDDILLVKLRSVNYDEKLTVDLRLVKPLTRDEFDDNVEAQISINKQKTKEITAELTSLREQQSNVSNSLSLDQTRTILNDNTLIELSDRIEILETELNEYSTDYNNAVNQVISKDYYPVLKKFFNKYEFNAKYEYSIIPSLMLIEGIDLTPENIVLFAKISDVSYISFSTINNDSSNNEVEEGEILSTSKLNEIYNIIDGETAYNNGYTGSNIVVGMVETGSPDINTVSDITYCNGESDNKVTAHATVVANIIKKMAPSCNIISASIASYNNSFVDALTTLLSNNNGIKVVNVSYGHYNSDEQEPINYRGKYNTYAYYIDELIELYRIPIVIGAGNSGNIGVGEERYNDSNVTLQGLAPNALCVGSVQHSGILPSLSTAFTHESMCSYNQFNGDTSTGSISMINKPDFCAPGDSLANDDNAHTSFSAPFVTGTIVQMMSRNSNFTSNSTGVHRDVMAKAALMASCFYTAGSDRDVYGIISSDKEGAGVINAGACYKIASNGSYQNYTLTSLGTVQKNISITDTTKPLRIAIAWTTESWPDISFTNCNIMLQVHKEGITQRIARSYARGYLYESSVEDQTGPVTNYQYVEIPVSTLATNGTGNYTVSIIMNSAQYNETNTRLSLAWCQY